jgi:hypothetical protein
MMMVLVNRLAILVQQLRREAIGADLERERPVGGRHESRGNQRAHAKGQQHEADQPLTMHPVEHCAGHGGKTCFDGRQSTPPVRRSQLLPPLSFARHALFFMRGNCG